MMQPERTIQDVVNIALVRAGRLLDEDEVMEVLPDLATAREWRDWTEQAIYQAIIEIVGQS